MSSGSATDHSGARRAWAWTAHLRSGGTAPWSGWAGEAEPGGRALPGAQQLELVRRLNVAGRPSDGLVDRVLTASAPGRGSPDLQLAGAAPDSPFGPRPVDPGSLPPTELLRVVTGLLADELIAAPLPALPDPPRPRPWSRSYRLAGDPAWSRAGHEHLVRRGRAPGGRRPFVVVLGAPLDRMLADLWTERCFDTGAPRWRDWLARWEERRAVPPRLDLPAIAASWAAGVGADRVRVVLDPEPLSFPVRVRGLPGLPSPCPADAAELARRTAPVLGLLVPRAERARRLREVLLPRAVRYGGLAPGVPAARAPWVERRARRMSQLLGRGDYAVVGDPGRVLPETGAEVVEPSGAAALDLGIRLLLEGGSPDRARKPGEERA